MQIGPFRQALLRKAGLLTIPANRLAKDLSMMEPLHELSPKQDPQRLTTQYAVYLLKD